MLLPIHGYVKWSALSLHPIKRTRAERSLPARASGAAFACFAFGFFSFVGGFSSGGGFSVGA